MTDIMPPTGTGPAVESPEAETPVVEQPAKPEKIDFPALWDGENRKQLTSLEQLAGFDGSVHTSIKRADFADEALYYDMRAAELDARAAGMRGKAADIRKIGNVADRARAKKLLSIARRMADLRASLTEQGVDVDALLAAAEVGDDG